VSRKLQIGKKLRCLPLQIGKKMICLPLQIAKGLKRPTAKGLNTKLLASKQTMKKHRRNGLKLTLKKVKSRAALKVAVKEIMGNLKAEAVKQCANIVAHRSIRFLIPQSALFLMCTAV
jgi:hypothetical protein